MTQKKEQLIVRLLNLRNDDSTSPSDLFKYSIQQIHHWIEIEEEKKRVAEEQPAAEPEPVAPPPPPKSAFDYFFGRG
jgi:hypothetical protein